MAASNTIDVRTHVMGDMLMLTGTFTDGGTDVSFDGLLTNVFAAGGHVTSLYDTGVQINMGAGLAAAATAVTVKTVDARLHFNVGETIYTDLGKRVGVITAIGSATSITIGGGVLTGGDMIDDEFLFKLGPDQSAVTLNNGSLAVSIDETNNFVVFGNGNLGAASVAHAQDGRWWILGQR